MAAPKRFAKFLFSDQIRFLAIVQCADYYMEPTSEGEWLISTPFFGEFEILATEIELLEAMGLIEWEDDHPVLTAIAAKESWDDHLMVRQVLFNCPGASEDQVLQICNQKYFNGRHIIRKNRITTTVKELVSQGLVVLLGKEEYHRNWWPVEFRDRIKEILSTGQSFTTPEILQQVEPLFPRCGVDAIQQYLMLLRHNQQTAIKQSPGLLQQLVEGIQQIMNGTWKELVSFVGGRVEIDHSVAPSRWAVAAV